MRHDGVTCCRSFGLAIRAIKNRGRGGDFLDRFALPGFREHARLFHQTAGPSPICAAQSNNLFPMAFWPSTVDLGRYRCRRPSRVSTAIGLAELTLLMLHRRVFDHSYIFKNGKTR